MIIIIKIKFRAWDIFSKKYIHRVLAGCNIRNNGYICNLVWDETKMDWVHFDESCGVLEPYTGLNDKNNKEIYVGDIVKSNKSKYKRFDDDGIYEVYFNEFLCHYALIASRYEWNHKNGQYDNYSLTGAKAKDFEIIGNIHENPELLK